MSLIGSDQWIRSSESGEVEAGDALLDRLTDDHPLVVVGVVGEAVDLEPSKRTSVRIDDTGSQTWSAGSSEVST